MVGKRVSRSQSIPSSLRTYLIKQFFLESSRGEELENIDRRRCGGQREDEMVGGSDVLNMFVNA